MLISPKQQAANRENAQHSTGPKTEAGKEAVRFNALTWGLRTLALMIDGDLGADYQTMWNEMAEQWDPQTSGEYYHLESMANAHWRLIRLTRSETRVYNTRMGLKMELATLERISVLRARLERAYISANDQLRRLQKDRLAKAEAEAEAAKTAEAAKPEPTRAGASKPAPAPVPPTPATTPDPPPDYVMSAPGPDTR